MEELVQIFTVQTNIYLMFLASFIGGVVASISPCSLSILPLIIGYVGGYSEQKPLKTFVQMIFFVIGSGLVFSLIGLFCALTGKIFVGNPYFALIIASVILIMGLNLVGLLDIQLPVLIKEIPKNNFNNDFLYPLLLGAVFAIIGSPCSTPILASIMAFSSISANIIQSVTMLFLFALGQGIIFILAGVITSEIKTSSEKYYKISEIILKISGFLLILVSLFIYYRVFSSVL
ncbi:MAG TPA: hypothetical protein DEO94_05705 [Cyanobacteria bacterium UBA11991]|nr:cytochrome c biogenesis protein CcdA [Cyanobacteriota bacterium]MDY6358597.1 cytochrome c biogenesis protein CcdA [Cyanobacteriota bacterium]MDY6364600.1 cytochrome c biogenesis protein CcdA [Cyanobacteriota bacterium]MDY6383464.1 cytochrome c biogenesis protein CcdA [Cyanobacteriota bacterium]HCB11612.1 hypothetical protein [Cyanobacteria bacterium UBA11991]